MWVGKFKIRHEDWILDKTEKYQVQATGIPLNSYTHKGKKFHNGFLTIAGTPQNKKEFLASIKRDKRVKKIEVRGNQILVLIQGEDAIAHLKDPTLFFIKPIIMKNGFEYWELGSWDKKKLQDFSKKVKSIAQIKILKLKKEFPAVFIQQSIPQLTPKQQFAIEKALEMGFYTFPRKHSLEEIAKKLKIPRTTLQEHLRKAEAQILPILINRHMPAQQLNTRTNQRST